MATNKWLKRIHSELTLTGVAWGAGLSEGDPVVTGAAGDVIPGSRVAPLTPTRVRHCVTRAVLTLKRGLAARAPSSRLTHSVTPSS